MKRFGNLYPRICSYENLLVAHQKARRGKAGQPGVRAVEAHTPEHLEKLQQTLIEKKFTTSEYEHFMVREPKPRWISKLPYFPDRIVHHAVMNVIQPIWDRIFIHDVYSAIPGRGIHAALDRLRKFLRNSAETRYCLQFDIEQFYPSVNHDILMELIARKIKCPDTLWLLEDIVRSTGGEKGIPIGNYLSQYFANIYLNWFDHWLKETLRIKYYIRYADDGVILAGSKRRLRAILGAIQIYLEKNLQLGLNNKTQVYPVADRGIDFVGYRTFPEYVLLRKRSARKFKRKLRTIKRLWPSLEPQHVMSAVMSYVGWIQHCNGFNLLQRYLLGDSILMGITDESARRLGIANPLRHRFVEVIV